MKTVFITGGSRGIGAEIVRTFSTAGYRVAFSYLQSTEAAETLANETGAVCLPCDVADSTRVEAAYQNAFKLLGHVDALVVNAGISQQKLCTDITDADWQRMMNVNLSGAFYTARAALPSMVSRKSGSIVFVSSMWGQVGASMEVHYSAAKAGMIGLARALAKETALSGIRVNCVAPGAIQTDMLTALPAGASEALQDEIPLARIGHAHEVAESVLWLCSDASSYVTGQVLGVNGGMVIG